MNPRLTTLISIIALCALYRVLPHPWNVSPVAAMALFAGAHFQTRAMAVLVPLAAMAVSDLLLGLHPTLPFVYGALVVTVALGFWVGKDISPARVLAGSLSGSLLFFFVTNAAVWLVGDFYPSGINGLWQALAAGVPFFQYTLLGDLVFNALFFGLFYALERHFPKQFAH
ncbi:DUF6580 family putative transport protein [Gallaecimonas pentaromativorans]|uniref:Rod shape-determining protein MreD n=1 Tax=Gallaecimonas pentaromativorans TaxID=584787 RepID=A0A3N1PJQ6_9GAMM|nr:DUF6580 family putative transport protein [Gallaecimonas pentaromativorans]ROQ24766.1 hypothetical protein EDC28_10613 [Gallaecimonas pentaromativorans]